VHVVTHRARDADTAYRACPNARRCVPSRGTNLPTPAGLILAGTSVHVIRGSVQRFGPTLRVNAELDSTETGAQLWSDSFDQNITDLALGQEQIVGRMRSALRLPSRYRGSAQPEGASA
jgi:hypothetical protein